MKKRLLLTLIVVPVFFFIFTGIFEVYAQQSHKIEITELDYKVYESRYPGQKTFEYSFSVVAERDVVVEVRIVPTIYHRGNLYALKIIETLEEDDSVVAEPILFQDFIPEEDKILGKEGIYFKNGEFWILSLRNGVAIRKEINFPLTIELPEDVPSFQGMSWKIIFFAKEKHEKAYDVKKEVTIVF